MGILDGKVAIVTGAGSGIGAGEACALGKEGAALVVVGRTLEKVARVAEHINRTGGKALALSCDVRIAGDVKAVVETTMKTFGAVDILVNNAQIMPEAHPLETWTEEEMADMWQSGAMGSWRLMLACFSYMKKSGGRIINTCSPTGHGTGQGYSGYSMAKEAIRALTRNAAREWGQYSINVNAISPVSLSDEQIERAAKTSAQKEAIYNHLGMAIRRFGHAENDIGRIVVFLAGPDSAMITGCTIGADGGSAML
jgi:NAD(P)-dependent dehydrogenase (short-subunit alcohol dehydrogenase family)